MSGVIVPNALRDEINKKLDAAIAGCPGAEQDRAEIYQQMLVFYDEHGYVPDFVLTLKEDETHEMPQSDDIEHKP